MQDKSTPECAQTAPTQFCVKVLLNSHIFCTNIYTRYVRTDRSRLNGIICLAHAFTLPSIKQSFLFPTSVRQIIFTIKKTNHQQQQPPNRMRCECTTFMPVRSYQNTVHNLGGVQKRVDASRSVLAKKVRTEPTVSAILRVFCLFALSLTVAVVLYSIFASHLELPSSVCLHVAPIIGNNRWPNEFLFSLYAMFCCA